MSSSTAAASPRPSAAIETGVARATRRWIAGSFAVAAALIAAVALDDAAGAQATVAPVLSCSGGMVLDSASGTCLTAHTTTALRPSTCPAGSTRVGGQYGGHVCQTKVTKKVDTGRTRQAYSHTTHATAWVTTGTERVQTGTNRTWIGPRKVTEPLVPPARVQVGTRTKTTKVTRPGPDVLYRVSYEAKVRTKRVVRRCSYDPHAGRQCWNATVTETHTEPRTRLECCIPGPPITETVTTDVPVYKWQTTRTSTIPGYWREDPVYETRETGYWDRVPTIHYVTVPVYETVTEWVTSPVTAGPCAAGWRAVGSQCQRTVLGPPSASATQSCPSGSVPRYGDSVGGTGPSALTCQSGAPGSGTDTGTSQDDSGGPADSPDGGARPLHHLAGESDERLAELGIHRCANGLLSYVPCDKLPGRTWDSDPDVCDGIEGTTYRPAHGGSCVTESDLLSKCTTPGDCAETTIRTYCPAIGELASTQIQEHAHPDRGAETYRVCIFDCSRFGTLPQYVRTRINGSYDYACLPVDDEGDDEGEDEVEDGDDETEEEEEETEEGEDEVEDGDDETEEEEEETEDGDDQTAEDDGRDDGSDDGRDDGSDDGRDDGSDDGRDDGSDDDHVDVDDDDDDSTDEVPPTVTTLPPGGECATVPPTAVATEVLAALGWESLVRTANAASSSQHDMPGGGRFLQVAPGRGWMRAQRVVQVSDPNCTWTVTQVRTAWSELRPWRPDERQRMEAERSTLHLAERWRALPADQRELRRKLMREWYRPGAVPAEVVCAVADAIAATASSDCDWLFRHPGAYAWRFDACFEVAPAPGSGPPDSGEGIPPAVGDCWATLASGVDWIRSVSDYADGRVTVTQGGAGP